MAIYFCVLLPKNALLQSKHSKSMRQIPIEKYSNKKIDQSNLKIVKVIRKKKYVQETVTNENILRRHDY